MNDRIDLRIHCGNTEDDTEGCVLVGLGRQEDRIVGSQLAFDGLMEKLQAAEGEITIDIVDVR